MNATTQSLEAVVSFQTEIAQAGRLLVERAKIATGIQAGILAQAAEILRGEWMQLELGRVAAQRKLRAAEGLTGLSQAVQAGEAPVLVPTLAPLDRALAKEEAPAPTPKALEDGRVVPNGIYTVVLEDGEHRTIRMVDDWREDAPAGGQVAQFLNGADNTSDYAGFAFVQGGRAFVWKRYGHRSHTRAALEILLKGRQEWEKAGKAYAVESGNCYVCNRLLTTPESVELGIGPVCRERVGA
jgi:hypothetical protein